MEQYIYYGCQQSIYFFIHTITSDEFNHDISGQIYNCMINETMITSPDKTVIIYDIGKDKTDVVVTQHEKIRKNFSIPNLEDQFIRLVNSTKKDEDKLIFSYEYDAGVFFTYEVPIDTDLSAIEQIKINKVHNYLTIKPLK